MVFYFRDTPLKRKSFLLYKNVRLNTQLRQVLTHVPTPGMYFKDSCRPYFTKFNILTLPCLYIYTAIVFVIENKHLTSEIKDSHNHQTRNINKLVQDKWISKFNNMDPIVTGIRFYNKTLEIFNPASSTSSSTLKSDIKQFLINKAFLLLGRNVGIGRTIYIMSIIC